MRRKPKPWLYCIEENIAFFSTSNKNAMKTDQVWVEVERGAEKKEIYKICWFGPFEDVSGRDFSTDRNRELSAGKIPWLKTTRLALMQKEIFVGTSMSSFIEKVKRVGGNAYPEPTK